MKVIDLPQALLNDVAVPMALQPGALSGRANLFDKTVMWLHGGVSSSQPHLAHCSDLHFDPNENFMHQVRRGGRRSPSGYHERPSRASTPGAGIAVPGAGITAASCCATPPSPLSHSPRPSLTSGALWRYIGWMTPVSLAG